MNDTIKAIFNSISTSCAKDCDYVTAAYGKECRKCLVAAELVYTAHVKPLEDALAKAESDLKKYMELAAEAASREDCLRQERDKERAVRAKAEADRAALAAALEPVEKVLDYVVDHRFKVITHALEQVRAALARVNGDGNA